jgi:prepilin peptidase CpaA
MMISTAPIAVSLAVTACALVWAAVSDFRLYLIPNRISLIIVAAFVFAACFMPISFLTGGVLTGLGVFAMAVFFFARGWMGGGDVKLLGAMALWVGPSFLSPFAVGTCMSGAALGILMLSPLKRLMPLPSADALSLAGGETAARQPMPFGVAIAIGGISVLARYLPLLQ